MQRNLGMIAPLIRIVNLYFDFLVAISANSGNGVHLAVEIVRAFGSSLEELCIAVHPD
jgi:hypothetical protein